MQIQPLFLLRIVTGTSREPMERVMGIEPTFSAWEADVLPLNYTRNLTEINTLAEILLIIRPRFATSRQKYEHKVCHSTKQADR